MTKPISYWDCYSSDGELYNRGGLKEAISDLGLHPGVSVYLGKLQPVTPHDVIPDTSDIIDRIQDNAWGLVGEIAEDYAIVDDDAHSELEDLLRNWVQKHCPPTFFQVFESVLHVVTAKDMEGVKC